MNTFVHFLPGAACAALMGIPTTVGAVRGRLRTRRHHASPGPARR